MLFKVHTYKLIVRVSKYDLLLAARLKELKLELSENLFDLCLQECFWLCKNICLWETSLITEKCFLWKTLFKKNLFVQVIFFMQNSLVCRKLHCLWKNSLIKWNYFAENFRACGKAPWLWKMSTAVEEFLDCGKTKIASLCWLQKI